MLELATTQSHKVQLISMDDPKRAILRFHITHEREEGAINERFFGSSPEQFVLSFDGSQRTL
jgi:hypothetical protein